MNAENHTEHNIYRITTQLPVNRQFGFLYPPNNSRKFLPENSDLNRQINLLALNLPVLIREKIFRREVNQLDLHFQNLPGCNLTNESDKHNAMVTLLMLAQAYIWEDPGNPANILPAIIAKDLYILCKQKQRLPTLTYSDYVLANWRLINENEEIHLANIEPVMTFTGTKDEAWFIKIHVVIEAVCAKALYAGALVTRIAFEMLGSKHHHDANEDKICLLLNDITSAITDATEILKKMLDGCNPSYYWRSLRHYLNGWEKVSNQGASMESGVKFAGVFVRNKSPIYHLKGASGAQSSILPALDAALGIKHDIDDMYQAMLTFRQYMPNEHVLFIDMLVCQNALKQLVEGRQSTKLQAAWETATASIMSFRREHINLVKHYIHQPAEYDGLETAAITGTGGAAIDDYLENRLKVSRN